MSKRLSQSSMDCSTRSVVNIAKASSNPAKIARTMCLSTLKSFPRNWVDIDFTWSSIEKECLFNDSGKYAKEYRYVVEGVAVAETVAECDGEQRIRDLGNDGKVLRDFAEMGPAKEARLSIAEVAVLRLFSGSLKQPWNQALRQLPVSTEEARKWGACLFAVKGAVHKLSTSNTTRNVCYRGILPTDQKVISMDSLCGEYRYLEAGFLSTTTSVEIALASVARQSNGMILQLDPYNSSSSSSGGGGGANIQWLSQYPQEFEVIFPAFSQMSMSQTPHMQLQLHLPMPAIAEPQPEQDPKHDKPKKKGTTNDYAEGKSVVSLHKGTITTLAPPTDHEPCIESVNKTYFSPSFMKSMQLQLEPLDVTSTLVSSTADVEYDQALTCAIAGDIPEAVEILNRLISMHQHLPSHFLLGNLYFHGIGVTCDCTIALDLWQRAALIGHLKSQLALGSVYQRGNEFVPIDRLKEIEYYSLAADQGDVSAQCILGICLMSEGVHKDLKKAAAYFKLAIERGHVKSQYLLGHSLREMGDITEAIHHFRAAADGGYSEAQFVLGTFYFSGDVVPQDFALARQYFELASDQGHSEAQYNLGICYKTGQGINKDLCKAFQLIKLSADSGVSAAQYQLYDMYSNGVGVKSSDTFAANYCKLAADQGHVEAKFTLGVCYSLGKGVAADSHKSFAILLPLADDGHAKSQLMVGLAYSSADGVERDLTRAAHYFKGAADQGLVEAQVQMTKCYSSGKGVRKDMLQAVYYCATAAHKGNSEAQVLLGTWFARGNWVEVNIDMARKFLKAAADQGSAEANYHLAMTYLDAKASDRDPSKAVSYFEIAAEKGHTESLFALGVSYNTGHGTYTDLRLAYYYYELAANKGHAEAQSRYGVAQTSGSYARKNVESGKAMLKLSAEQGNRFAQYFLGMLYFKDYETEETPAVINEAILYLKRASAGGDDKATTALGVIYGSISAVKDDSQAVKYYKFVCDRQSQSEYSFYNSERGNHQARLNLGVYYATGRSVERDAKLAAHYLHLAVSEGGPLRGSAWYNLGLCYSQDLGVEVDLEKAKHYNDQAKEKGHVLALADSQKFQAEETFKSLNF